MSGQARVAWLRQMKRRVTRSRNPKNDIWPDQDQYREFYKFTVVRSPWDRLRSMYRNLMRDPTHAFLRGESVPDDFSTFVERWAGIGLMRPMSHWLVDRNGDVPFDEIIEFEELKSAWPRIARRLGLPFEELSHENRGARATDVDFNYSEAAWGHVLRTYAWEFAYFGYSKTPA